MPILDFCTLNRTFRKNCSRVIRVPLLVCGAFAVSSVPSGAEAAVRARLQFDAQFLRMQAVPEGTQVTYTGARDVGGIDSPSLPIVTKMFAIPDGQEVSDVFVSVIRERRIATHVTLVTRASRNVEEEGSSRPYPEGALDPQGQVWPARPGLSLGSGSFGGFKVHSVGIFPVRYDASTSEVFLAEEVEIEVVTRVGTALSGLRRPVGSEGERFFGEALRAIVANPQDVPVTLAREVRSEGPSGFDPRDLPSLDGSSVDFVIVTTSALSANFQTLANWKTKKGVPTVVRTTDFIEANYPQGHDLPERIRFFLQDAYQKWGIRYALLAGDYDIVPPREVYNRFFFGGTLVPSDQYYACLEGDWNADRDDRYGEGQYQLEAGDLVDLYPDLFVGRAPVASTTEANTFVNKSMTYEKTPPAGYVKSHGIFAEVLFPSDWEYGDPPGNISLDGKTLAEQLDLLVDPTWTRFKKYQSDNNLDRTIALSELEIGRHLQTVVAHGDAFKFSVGNGINPLIYKADADTLGNGNRLTFLCATACNPNQFDLECQGESFLLNPGGGAIAVCGPTREDFPLSANDYYLAMYDLIFNKGYTSFGVMNQLKRVSFVPVSQTDSTPDRWTMFTSTLMGDPELRFWTNEPTSLLATHSGSISVGSTSLTVTVTNSSAVPQADALVCISDAAGTYSRGRTNASGQVVLPVTSSATGSLAVVATKMNFKPYEGTTTLTTNVGAALAVSTTAFDDDAAAPSNGNGDLRVDAGERVEVDFTVRNTGNAVANTVTVTPSILTGSTATFDLLYGGTGDVAKVFVGSAGANPATMPFTLNFASPSIDYFGIPSHVLSPDSTSAERGIFLWQDHEGWHLEWNTGDDSTQVSGTITTDGKVLSTASTQLETGFDTMTVNGGQTQITFGGWTHARDNVDGFDFALADNSRLSIFGGAAALGNIAAGGTANGTVTFDVTSAARAGQVGYVSLAMTSTSGGPWSDVVPVVFSGPRLESYVHSVNDGTPPASGNGNGIPEVGETIQLITTVLNRGTGTAVSVDGALTAGAGITLGDAADSYGNIVPLAQDLGTNGYTFTITNVSGTQVTLTLTDSQGRTTVKNVDFVRPATPANFTFDSTPTAITLQWAPNVEPDLAGYHVYRSAVTGGPYSKVSFELLRTGTRFVDDGLSLGTTFYYKVSAVDLSGNESVHSAELAAWTTQAQLAGWPKTANSNVFSSLAIADADNSGESELYVGSQDFSMYVFEPNGNMHGGFPVATDEQIWGAPGLADLDKDGDLELLFGSRDTRFYVYREDGSAYFGGSNPWFVDLPGSGEEIRTAATIADVDRDSRLEFFFGSDLGRIYGFNHDGTPIVPGNGELFVCPPGDTQARVWGTLAVADLANDGTREIVFTSWNDSLYVITPTGTRVPGFPRGASGGANNDFKRGPVIGDLDADGTKEILAGSFNGNLYCFNHDGSNYLAGPVFATLPGAATGSPALANLDADPQLEVVVGCEDGKIYAFNHNGTGFTQTGGLFAHPDPAAPIVDQKITASPIIVNVDGDSDFEIFIGNHTGKFYGYHHTGVLMAGFPIKTDLPIHSTAAAGDFDGNGDLEVAFASYDGTVNVLDFTGPAVPAAMPWPTYAQNNARTAVYGEAGPYQTGAEGLAASFSFSLDQNAPNPFQGQTQILFAAPHSMAVKLGVYDVQGRLVKSLYDGTVAAGQHRVTWDGRDESGKATTAGVYFYRLDGPEKTLTRKSIRVR